MRTLLARTATKVAAAILLTLICGSFAPPSVTAASNNTTTNSTSASASSIPTNATGLISIDKSAFIASVPSSAIIGENYTLRVEVLSNETVAVPVLVRVVAPVTAIFVRPLLIHATVPPMGIVVANFFVVPFANWHLGPLNVTAQLYVFFVKRMTSPQLISQVTAYVRSISPSSFPYLDLSLLSAAVVALIVLVVFRPNLVLRGRRGASNGHQETQIADRVPDRRGFYELYENG